jgi:ABC-type Na+ efflux pump permease subunit
MRREGTLYLVGCVVRREMNAFFRARVLWGLFIVQPLFMATLFGSINRKLLPVFALRPDLLLTMVSRQVSVLLPAFALMSVLHIFQKAVAAEKGNRLIDTLLTTPLTVRQLVWGKALQLGGLGYAMGLLLAALNIAGLSYLVGNPSLITHLPPYYWLFTFVVAPVVIVGILAVGFAASLAVGDARLVLLPFTLAVAGLIATGASYQSAEAEHVVMLALTALGLACLFAWWAWGARLSKEQVVSR